MARSAMRQAGSEASNPLRPIFIMSDHGVMDWEKQAVINGLVQVMVAAGVSEYVPAYDLGAWRGEGWRDEAGYLAEWKSVDWYIAYVKERSRHGQLHGGKLLSLLYSEPWQEMSPHYDIAITSSDLYDDDCDFCIGLAVTGFGAVVSTARFRGLGSYEAYDCIVTETMHEVGHVFGLVPETRTENVNESLGLHCTNRCIMRQGLVVPNDWQTITADRLLGHEFCPECQNDIRQHFRS